MNLLDPITDILDWLEAVIAQAMTLLKDYLTEAAEKAIEYTQEVLEWLWESTWKLLRISVALLVLAYVGSFAHELTYGPATWSKVLGWGLFVTWLGLAVWVIIKAFLSRSRQVTGAAPLAIWSLVILNFVFMIVIGAVVLLFHYRWRSPVLRTSENILRGSVSRVVGVFAGRSRPTKTREPQSVTTVGPRKIVPGSWMSVESMPAPSKKDEERITLWAERMCVASDRTMIQIGCKGWADSDEPILDKAAEAYLVDDKGKKYDLQTDECEYDRPWFLPAALRRSRKIIAGAVYKCVLSFEEIPGRIERFTLRHPQFKDVVIVPNWFGEAVEAVVRWDVPEEHIAYGRVTKVGGNIVQPRFEMATVSYPLEARRACRAGMVTLSFEVDGSGYVGNIQIVASTSPGFGFEESAVNALRQWHWQPARRDGQQAIGVAGMARFTFLLHGVSSE